MPPQSNREKTRFKLVNRSESLEIQNKVEAFQTFVNNFRTCFFPQGDFGFKVKGIRYNTQDYTKMSVTFDHFTIGLVRKLRGGQIEVSVAKESLVRKYVELFKEYEIVPLSEGRHLLVTGLESLVQDPGIGSILKIFVAEQVLDIDILTTPSPAVTVSDELSSLATQVFPIRGVAFEEEGEGLGLSTAVAFQSAAESTSTNTVSTAKQDLERNTYNQSIEANNEYVEFSDFFDQLMLKLFPAVNDDNLMCFRVIKDGVNRPITSTEYLVFRANINSKGEDLAEMVGSGQITRAVAVEELVAKDLLNLMKNRFLFINLSRQTDPSMQGKLYKSRDWLLQQLIDAMFVVMGIDKETAKRAGDSKAYSIVYNCQKLISNVFHYE